MNFNFCNLSKLLKFLQYFFIWTLCWKISKEKTIRVRFIICLKILQRWEINLVCWWFGLNSDLFLGIEVTSFDILDQLKNSILGSNLKSYFFQVTFT